MSAQATTYTLLVTLFESIGYAGTYTTLGGRFGTCDAAGYGFSDLNYANAIVYGISSYKLNGACRYSTIWTSTGYTGSVKGFSTQNVNFVGYPLNDNVRSMKVGA